MRMLMRMNAIRWQGAVYSYRIRQDVYGYVPYCERLTYELSIIQAIINH